MEGDDHRLERLAAGRKTGRGKRVRGSKGNERSREGRTYTERYPRLLAHCSPSLWNQTHEEGMVAVAALSFFEPPFFADASATVADRARYSSRLTADFSVCMSFAKAA